MVQHIDQSYKPILDREGAAEMSSNFADIIELVCELVDYGSNLIPRAYASSERDLKAICLILVQLRQFVSQLDGMALLLAQGACAISNLQLRGVLEIAHTLEWTLQSDTLSKIHHLYVANLRRRRNWNRVAIPGTVEAIHYAAKGPKLILSVEQQTEVWNELIRIDSLLADPQFAPINQNFESHYRKHHFDEPWYKIYGARSIRQVSKDIGKLSEYDGIYLSLSGVTHGSDIWRSIFFGTGKLAVAPIREPQHIPSSVQLAVTITLRVYTLVLKEFRSGEEENFARKYRAEWRARFLKKYQIEIKPTETVI